MLNLYTDFVGHSGQFESISEITDMTRTTHTTYVDDVSPLVHCVDGFGLTSRAFDCLFAHPRSRSAENLDLLIPGPIAIAHGPFYHLRLFCC